MVFLVCVSVTLFSCQFPQKKEPNERTDSLSVLQTSALPRFKMVVPPAVLISPQERVDYMVRHYWDSFNFRDTAFIHAPEVTEQALSNYIDLFSYTDLETIGHSLRQLLDRAKEEPRMYEYFSGQLNKYLNDPNSSLRNDEYYLIVIDHLLQSKDLQEAERIRLHFKKERLKRNRVGKRSSDFRYQLASGKTGRLYEIQGLYTLLLFYNPDCHSCENVIDFLKTSVIVNELVSSGRMTILSVYTDEDLEIWRKHLCMLPDTWIRAYDYQQDLTRNKLYDLHTIPALYLLDESKHVLLKDASVQQIEHYLWQHIATIS